LAVARTLFNSTLPPGIQPHLDQYFYDAGFYIFSPAGCYLFRCKPANAAKDFVDCQQEKPHEPGNALRWERTVYLMVDSRPDHAARQLLAHGGKLVYASFYPAWHFWEAWRWAGSARDFFFTDAGRHRACAWISTDGARRNYYGDDDGHANALKPTQIAYTASLELLKGRDGEIFASACRGRFCNWSSRHILSVILVYVWK